MTILRSDNFNRPDDPSALGFPSDGGSAWLNYTTGTGAYGISSFQAYKVAGSSLVNDIAALEAGTPVASVRLTCTALSNDEYLLGRISDGLNFIAVNFGHQFTDGAIFKDQAGVPTTLVSFPRNPLSAGDIIGLDFYANNLIYAYKNDVLIASVTSSFNSTATQFGFAVTDSGISGRYDDFSISDVPSGATNLPGQICL